MTSRVGGTEINNMSKDLGGVTEEMLACPFCDSASIDPEGWASLETKGPACDDCGASAGGCSKSHAENIAAWNTRASAAVADGERYREALVEARGELLRQQRGGDPDREEHCSSIIKHIDRVLAPEAAASDQGENA